LFSINIQKLPNSKLNPEFKNHPGFMIDRVASKNL